MRPYLPAITTFLNLVCASLISEPDGPWPTELYRSTSVFGTSVYFAPESAACHDGLYTLLTPRGKGAVAQGPTILNQDGDLVWKREFTYGVTYNLDVQEYKGDSYLTFWESYNKVDGHGDGTIRMLDSQYQERYQIKGPNGYSADLQDFHITRDDTALFTVYDIISADLKSVYGPSRGWILDSGFVEVDIETNEVLFEWRASHHFNFTDVNAENLDSAGSTDSHDWDFFHPWDFFHINSVDKDAKGNYLISALYTDHLTYLDGRTGNVIWRLGGIHSDFEDRSLEKRASIFAWPHDARFRDDDKAISLFDNATPEDDVNRGVLLDVDQSNMTVNLRAEYRPDGDASALPTSQLQSDGSVQVLQNGDVLVSYGLNGAAWTEFSELGDPKCHAQFGAVSSFGTGDPASYRVKKRPWIGNPNTTPAFEIDGYSVAVSWNGATEVDKWVLEGAQVALPNAYPNSGYSNPNDQDGNYPHSPNPAKPDTDFSAITTVKKEGFETIIDIPFISYDNDYPFLRVRALDKKGLIIGTSAILPFPRTTSDAHHPFQSASQSKTHHSPALFFAGVCATLIVLACIFLLRRFCWAACVWSCRRIQRRRYLYLHPDRRGSESNWEQYLVDEEQEVGLHIASDSESDDSDVEFSELDNPRLSPAIYRTSSRQRQRSG